MSDWLQWESADRPTAWSGLLHVAEVVVRRVGARFQLQAADREDLAADVTYLAVENDCARLRALDGDVSLPAWLWGVARNLARQSRRQRTARPLPADGPVDPVPGPADPIGADAPHEVTSAPVAQVATLLRVMTPSSGRSNWHS